MDPGGLHGSGGALGVPESPRYPWMSITGRADHHSSSSLLSTHSTSLSFFGIIIDIIAIIKIIFIINDSFLTIIIIIIIYVHNHLHYHNHRRRASVKFCNRISFENLKFVPMSDSIFAQYSVNQKSYGHAQFCQRFPLNEHFCGIGLLLFLFLYNLFESAPNARNLQ